MKHGEELRCSHPVCQAGGVKFCYCAVCKKPAAKRNFRGRHHHIDEDPRVDARNDFPENLKKDVARKSMTSVPQESMIESINNPCSHWVSQEDEQISGTKQDPRHNIGDDSSSRKSPITSKSGTRDSVVMSCKARGMPTDHNSKARMFIFLVCFSICHSKLRD